MIDCEERFDRRMRREYEERIEALLKRIADGPARPHRHS